jgi:hypothetical protein
VGVVNWRKKKPRWVNHTGRDFLNDLPGSLWPLVRLLTAFRLLDCVIIGESKQVSGIYRFGRVCQVAELSVILFSWHHPH